MSRDELTDAAINGDRQSLEKLLADEPKLPTDILQRAIFSGWSQGADTQVLEMLIEHGSNVDQLADKSRPLHEAARVGPFPNRSSAATRLLLGKGADPNKKDSLGQTPLHIAVTTIAHETSRLLIEAGANVDARDGDEHTPLYCCLMSFLEHLSDTDDEEEQAIDRENATEYVLEQLGVLLPAKPDLAGEGDGCPVGVALYYRMPEEIVRKLIEAGAPFDKRVAVEDKAVSPLILALSNAYSSEMMVEFARVNDPRQACWIGGDSCIEVAATQFPEAARVLIENDPGLITHKNAERNVTLLHFAAAGGDLALVTYLAEKGLSLTARTNKGKTPLDLAKEYEHEDVAEYLQRE